MFYQENSGNPAREFSFVVMLLDYFAWLALITRRIQPIR
jgi:hypothetical protein